MIVFKALHKVSLIETLTCCTTVKSTGINTRLGDQGLAVCSFPGASVGGGALGQPAAPSVIVGCDLALQAR